jgi:hypothetical protein
MTTIPSPQPPLDRFAIAEKVRSVFERSAAFRDARISDPQTSPEGQVSISVAFGRSPALFRVVAPSVEKAYAILYELARGVVEKDVRRQGQGCA